MTYQTIEAIYSPHDHTIILPSNLDRYHRKTKVLVIFPSLAKPIAKKNSDKKSGIHFSIDTENTLDEGLQTKLTKTVAHKRLQKTVDILFGKKIGK